MTHVFGWVWDGAHWITWLNSFNPQTRPLTDSVLHFHIVSTKVDFSQLHHRVHVLGGKISFEENLTEHVTYVVTDKDPTREEREPFSRGQLLLRKAAAKSLGVTEQAKELRVKLWNVTSFLRWVECQLEYVGSPNLSGPAPFQYPEQKQRNSSKFISQLNIKVEDGRQRFKPQQKPLKEPYLHLDPEYPASPFDEPSYQQKFVKRERLRKLEEINNNNIDKSFKDAAGAKKKEEQLGANNNSKKSVRANQPKQQFCECCNAYFLHLDEHLQSEQHRKFFGANEDHFRCVKDLIDKLHPQWMGTLPISQDTAANVSSSTPPAQGKALEHPAFPLPLESSLALPDYPPYPTGNQFNRKPAGRSVMHPASAAYALNMRQHMLNQAYRNATASAQQQTGIGPPHGLLGRQTGTNSGHYDHPPHHAVSGVNLKGAEVHDGVAVGGHRTGASGGPGGVAASHNMASSSNPFQLPELLSGPESLLAAATSGVPLDFSRTSSQTFAAAMMRDFGHLPPPQIPHPHMLSHPAAYNLSQAAASSHEKMLDDWLPKLQDQLNHSQQQQNPTQQALDMWGAALGQDQSSQAAQAQAAQAAQATADLFAALAGSAEQADFASLGLQNLLQTMVSVEEENRKRAQHMYNQANQQHQNHLLQSQTQSQHKKSDKAQHPLLSVSSASQAASQNHHTQSQLIPNQLPPSIAQTRQDAQEASLSPEEIAEENKFTPREAQVQPSPSQATPSPQGPNNRVARTPTYDSPLHVRSQYNSPLPKDEIDFQQPQQQQQQQQQPQQQPPQQQQQQQQQPVAPHQQKKAQNQHRLEPQNFNNQKQTDSMKQFNPQQQQQQAPPPLPPPPPQQQQNLPDLQKYIDAPPQQEYVHETPPQQSQQNFPAEISGRQAAMNKYQEVVSPFDGQQGQKTPFYENPHSVPTPLQNPPSVPMNNPPSVPMNEGHTPQHTPHHQHTHSNTPQHVQSPANLHGRAQQLQQPQPPQQQQQQQPQQQQQQQQCMEKYDFQEELTEKMPPWQSDQATTSAAGEKQPWQNAPQFEAISSDNGKQENLMVPCAQNVGATQQEKEISPAAAPYEKELPSKYLKGRGYQQPPIGLNQESNDQLSSQDSNSMQNSIASNTPQHSGAGLPTSFRYQNETSKDSLDLEKKSYPVQSAGSGAHEGSSHNRWTAQRKSARGRYGGIKLKFTPAGRKSIAAAAGYNTSGNNHSMFSPSQNSNAAKGDPYDWNEDEEVSVSPMKRKAAAQSSHLSFSQFTQKQQNAVPQDNSNIIGGYGSMQQSGGQIYSQQSYQQQQQQQYPLHQQNVHQSHMSQAYQVPGPHNSFQSVAGSSNTTGVYASSNPDQAAQNEWKMKMVSETKIVLKKFNPPSGGKPASYKHPRKRHL